MKNGFVTAVDPWTWSLMIQGQTGSHFEPKTVPPPLPNKCDWEVDPSELDFSTSVCIGKVFSTFSRSYKWILELLHCILSMSTAYCGKVVVLKMYLIIGRSQVTPRLILLCFRQVLLVMSLALPVFIVEIWPFEFALVSVCLGFIISVKD